VCNPKIETSRCSALHNIDSLTKIERDRNERRLFLPVNLSEINVLVRIDDESQSLHLHFLRRHPLQLVVIQRVTVQRKFELKNDHGSDNITSIIPCPFPSSIDTTKTCEI